MADKPSSWKPTVERRVHPFGERGVQSSLDEVAKKAAEGALHFRVRKWAGEVLDLAKKRGEAVSNDVGRARVLLKAVQQKLWMPDPVGAEWIPGAHLMACSVDDKDGPCLKAGDCFPKGTLLLDRAHNLVHVEDVKEGTEIWGLGAWTKVEATAYKGILPIDVIKLNNGSEMRLTGDHHVLVAECSKHKKRNATQAKGWCSCPVSGRSLVRTKVSDLRPGMVLLSPEALPFGSEAMDPKRAYVEGLFAAEGWSDQNSRFCISGKDGHPKEAQKHEVKNICDALGVHTRWHKRYIAVNDGSWALRVQQMGRHAPEKRLLSINLDEASATECLRGVMADSGKNTAGYGRTFTTTSHRLAVQVRVLHKFFGVSCGWRYIEDHGGLGTHPIWRVCTRGKTRVDGRAAWLLRVESIDRCVVSVPCYDIQTTDHHVYLPEHDVTVENCDDLSVVLGAACTCVGIPTLIVGHGYDTDKNISHVLCAVHANGRWWYADPSTDFALGKHVKFTRERVLAIPSGKVVCDAKSCLAGSGSRSISPDVTEPVGGGTFIGVNGLPSFSESRVRWLDEEEKT